MSSTGIDGAPLNWPLCEEGMLAFQRDTLPLLKQARIALAEAPFADGL